MLLIFVDSVSLCLSVLNITWTDEFEVMPSLFTISFDLTLINCVLSCSICFWVFMFSKADLSLLAFMFSYTVKYALKKSESLIGLSVSKLAKERMCVNKVLLNVSVELSWSSNWMMLDMNKESFKLWPCFVISFSIKFKYLWELSVDDGLEGSVWFWGKEDGIKRGIHKSKKWISSKRF